MHGSGRHYANGLQRHNGQGNPSQQSNDERSMAACALKPYDEGQANGHQKDEQQTRGRVLESLMVIKEAMPMVTSHVEDLVLLAMRSMIISRRQAEVTWKEEEEVMVGGER